MALNSIPEIIEDIRRGKMVVLMDDEGRENEGDLIMAATAVTAEHINFMARYARGLICLTLTQQRCAQLRLPLMVTHNDTKHGTNFTVSIEAAEGVTTGISAADRAHTVRVAAAPDAKPGDLVQPGHIFPLMAQPGGVLTRAGHTEAGCDLAHLAGLESAAVIVEILNEDGTMARQPDLEVFAKAHGLKMGTVADLIQYRLMHEKTMQRTADRRVATPQGEFRCVAYRDDITNQTHLAFVAGTLREDQPATVRVHLADAISDLVSPQDIEPRWTFAASMTKIAADGNGVVILLGEPDAPEQWVERLFPAPHTVSRRIPAMDLRTYGSGAQILRDLGVRRMRVLSSPKRMHALSGFGLEVTEYIAPDASLLKSR
jgi:3,4-dihydroxy 2-butanone 4-phosphate synthase / GTP cyclohydrolase II